MLLVGLKNDESNKIHTSILPKKNVLPVLSTLLSYCHCLKVKKRRKVKRLFSNLKRK